MRRHSPPPCAPLALLVLLASAAALCLAAPGERFGDAGDGAPECAPDMGARCEATPGGIFKLTGTRQTSASLEANSFFFHGVFTVDLKFENGSTGTSFSLSDLIPDQADPAHAEITMRLYPSPFTPGQTMMETLVQANQAQNTQLFHLPFDGSVAYHTYSIRWSQDLIVWSVDNKPIRILEGTQANPWPSKPLLPQVIVTGFTAPQRPPSIPAVDPVAYKAFQALRAKQALGRKVPMDRGVPLLTRPDKKAAADAGPGTVLAGQEVAQDVGPGQDVPTSTWVSSVLFLGCTVAQDAGQDGCPSMTNPTPWYRPLTAEELRVYNAWHYVQLLADSRWVVVTAPGP